MSKKFKKEIKEQLTEIFLKLIDKDFKLKKLTEKELRTYENIIVGLGFDLSKQLIEEIIKDKILEKEIKKKEKSKNKFTWFSEKVKHELSENEKIEIETFIETVIQEEQISLKTPKKYTHSVISLLVKQITISFSNDSDSKFDFLCKHFKSNISFRKKDYLLSFQMNEFACFFSNKSSSKVNQKMQLFILSTEATCQVVGS